MAKLPRPNLNSRCEQFWHRSRTQDLQLTTLMALFPTVTIRTSLSAWHRHLAFPSLSSPLVNGEAVAAGLRDT